uniref:Uncharacterized protein n=1 Tax=Meloidogyne enterolobii TaxID=390850 RepID=A0A6V7VI89_MELEN|nr:unnamed protein product [Meloidogyne enterolobii]
MFSCIQCLVVYISASPLRKFSHVAIRIEPRIVWEIYKVHAKIIKNLLGLTSQLLP